MPRPGKRRLEDFDPNQSDPNDSDFNDEPSSPQHSRRRSHKKKSSSHAHRTPQKKRSRRNYGSDSDIVDDDDDISEEEFTASSEDEEVEVNPVTGRAIRRAAKKKVDYEESEDDDEKDFIEDTAESDDGQQEQRDELTVSPKKSRNLETARSKLHSALLKPSRLVKLPFTRWDALSLSNRPTPAPEIKEEQKVQRARSTRSRTASHPPVTGTRRSSRLSKEPEPLQALSSSGRHAIPASRTHSPDYGDDSVIDLRRTRGSKGPQQHTSSKQPARKMPSTVMEASHEGTQDFEMVENQDGDAPVEAEEQAPQDVVDSVETHTEEIVGEVEGQQDPVTEEAAQEGEEEEGPEEQAKDEDSDESDGPVGPRRTLRSRAKPANRSPAKRKRAEDESSEFAPDDEAPADDEDMSEGDDGRRQSKRLRAGSNSQSQNGGRKARNTNRSRQQSSDGEDSDDIDPDELAEEAHDLKRPTRESRRTRQAQSYATEGINYESEGRRRRTTKNVDYSIRPLEELYQEDQLALAQSDGEPSQGGKKRKKRKPRDVRLHSVRGIFGGFTHGPALLTSELDDIAIMGAEPESSDDEDDVPTVLKTPAAHDAAGGPADFGKINKEKKAAGADADPLGVDETVKFDAVGGLDDHINALKEMVLHPLMYPEVIGKFGVQPPRGVLFHGPPGTGKTLLARALSNSIETEGKKVTFFMRKGADALSKWVGEAERQLRLLFEEAQKCQPSIIFFDEIDGLAPTRSSKTEQIHASIVATLLALMDGMDNRGQVVVIGATNRPDNVDPALRRPGRFDREFYFPLPDKRARRAIIDINTKGWDPPLSDSFKDQLAELTVGYGGADLRALCTEAALNAIQGTYPQIYKSTKKLLVDPSKIKVLAKDFMISVNKITPSSARSHTSKVEPLQKSVEPLLRTPLEKISEIIDRILPRRPKLTALQEAEYDDRDDEKGFERETLQREIDRARVFRPRMLIRGLRGMGQHELSSALLHKLEGLFVQPFDMATLMEDSSRSPEAAVVQLFKEVRRQKPSIIFLPDVDVWYQTVGDNVLKIFTQQLRAIPPNDPVLLLGMMSTDTIDARPDPLMMRDLFGFSKRADYVLERPGRDARYEYFTSLISLVKKPPSEFPDPANRKKRTLPELPEIKASPAEMRAQDRAKRKQQYREERNALNLLKMSIGVVFEQVKKKYGILRNAQIPFQQYKYLFEEADEGNVTGELTEEQRQTLQNRPFVIDKDRHGRGVLREVATGKYYYNMDIEDIEERLANGYYRRWKDFLADIRTIMHDAMTMDPMATGDPDKQDDRRRKTQELVNNVEVDLEAFRREKSQLDQQLAVMYSRVLEEYKEKKRKGIPINPLEKKPIGTTTNAAPIVGRPPAPGERHMGPPPPVTPVRYPHPPSHVHTNGDVGSGHLTNGSTVPSRADAEGDVHMADVDTRAVAGAQPYSQTSALEKMKPGSQVDDYRNSGSTTTEGHSHSNRTSGAGGYPAAATAPSASLQYSAHTPSGFPHGYAPAPSTAGYAFHGLAGPHAQSQAQVYPGAGTPGVAQHNYGGASTGFLPAQGGTGVPEEQPQHHENSNGTDSRYYPNWDSAGSLMGGSQIPDTQPATEHTNSIPRSHGTASGSSTQPAPTATNKVPNDLASILNKPETPRLELREHEIEMLHDMLADKTSGFSVEQLVQCMAELVNEVVRLSGEWDKRVVVQRLRDVFEECRRDIEEMQLVMDGSYGI
ncbi:uncharacterized protein PV09_06104 [Verruconis gallopava]|uniref:AAA+ ATPase domain-containing protein n=1 Tax=Verruconis gallopava TaxID=253628 RepID=A0A0D1YPX1_9PEZI|nr:uncharacterized protein PV09_06104 [Verruconis gallopava]KIW02667.1 hypothetical protein PV09_06104 [Verruconis gallopava]